MWTFLAAAVGPLAIRALTAIGFASVSFAGVQLAYDALLSSVTSSWSALPVAVLQLASIAGVPAGLGIIFGAFSARIALWLATNATRLLFRG
jgi:hypothetical protein